MLAMKNKNTQLERSKKRRKVLLAASSFTKEVPSRLWYLPYHEVVNPNKPGKVRRVANAASKFKGQSLNSNLLTGPDLLENFTGVLRFRKFGIATQAAFVGMFMQISIEAEDRCPLYFLWNHNNNIRHYKFSRLTLEQLALHFVLSTF